MNKRTCGNTILQRAWKWIVWGFSIIYLRGTIRNKRTKLECIHREYSSVLHLSRLRTDRDALVQMLRGPQIHLTETAELVPVSVYTANEHGTHLGRQLDFPY